MIPLKKYPDEGELVVCTVRKVKNYGAFVTLDEYNGLEGFIPLAEVSTGCVKYIKDYIREEQKVVCKVIRVDEEKGIIDLSLKRVGESQRREKIQQWKNEQRAWKLFEILAQNLGKSVEECFEEFGRSLIEKYGSLYGAFEEVAMNEDVLEEDNFKGEWVEEFIKLAHENITPRVVKISGYLDLFSTKPDGIKHIKEALLAAEKEGVTVQYVGAPRYRLIVKAPDYKEAEEILKRAAEKAISIIEKRGGEGKFYRRL